MTDGRQAVTPTDEAERTDAAPAVEASTEAPSPATAPPAPADEDAPAVPADEDAPAVPADEDAPAAPADEDTPAIPVAQDDEPTTDAPAATADDEQLAASVGADQTPTLAGDVTSAVADPTSSDGSADAASATAAPAAASAGPPPPPPTGSAPAEPSSQTSSGSSESAAEPASETPSEPSTRESADAAETAPETPVAAPPPTPEPAPGAWRPRAWDPPTVVIPPAALADDAPAYTPATLTPPAAAAESAPVRVSRLERTSGSPADDPLAVDRPTAATPPLSAAAVPPGPPAEPVSPAEPVAPAPAAPVEDPPTQVLPAADPEPAAPPARPSSPMDAFPVEEHRRRWPRVLGIVAAVVVVLAGAYVGALWLWADRVPPGATVAGVELGGMSAQDAEAALVESLDTATTEPLPVAAGENRTTVDPVAAGLTLDAEATIDSLTGLDLRPQRLWDHLFGTGESDPVTQVDEEALAAAVEGVAAALDVDPVDGAVLFVDAAPQSTDAVDGSAVDVDAAAQTIRDGWLTDARPLELPTEVIEPQIGQDEVDRVLAEVARPLVAAPVTVAVGEQLAELPPDVLASAASFAADGEQLVLQLDGAVLVEAVTVRTTDLLTSPADGSFAFQDGVPVIVPGTPGTTLDPATLAQAVAAAGTSADRTARVDLVEVAPTESTAELEALGIVEIVSEFSTPLNSEPRRTANIANGASKITGTLIRPGETFSLAEALGPVDGAHGFVQAGAIVNGEHTDAWGGGLSQLSTTTYNAAFFAGFEDIEHHPHSEWFSRYPEGREATIFTGSLDMRWKNNTPYGALVQAWVEGGRTHVRIWGTKYWEVQESTSGRSGIVAPTTVYSQSPTCEPQSAGNPGFSVTVTRRLLLQGAEQSADSWTVRYKPQNQVVCGPPPGG